MHEKVETLMRSQGLGERADSLKETLGEQAEHLRERAESLRESLKEGMEGAVNASVGGVQTFFGVSTAMGFLLSLLLCSVLAIFLALSIQYLYHLWTCQKRGTRRFWHAKVPLVKSDWKKDIVYLFQFPRSKFVPNASPHCLKLETFLRHHRIHYEVVETMTLRSVEGKLPFIELNGEHLQDSELIIDYLIKHFNIDTDSGLSEQQQGMVRAVSRMIEHATHYPLLYFKMGKNVTKFYESNLEGHAPKFLKWLSPFLVYPQVWDKLNMEGTGLHTDKEVESILRADLQALDSILGEHEWLIGNQPTLADFTFFGHIASAFNLPFDLPLHLMLFDEFPRLRALHARMAFRYFPEFSFRQIGTKSTLKDGTQQQAAVGQQRMDKIAE